MLSRATERSRYTVRDSHAQLRKISELNSGSAPDADKIDFDELADIRLNEEVFETWRDIVNRASAAATADSGIDQMQFRTLMDDFQADWERKGPRYTGKRLNDIMSAEKQISFGALAGLATDTASGKPLYKALMNVILGPV